MVSSKTCTWVSVKVSNWVKVNSRRYAEETIDVGKKSSRWVASNRCPMFRIIKERICTDGIIAVFSAAVVKLVRDRNTFPKANPVCICAHFAGSVIFLFFFFCFLCFFPELTDDNILDVSS